MRRCLISKGASGGINGAWVITAYLIGEIIVIPMTDFLSRVFSLRRYLITNTALFLCFSVACGQASSMSEMIVLRALQGFSGGVLIPLAFTIVVAMLPPASGHSAWPASQSRQPFAPAISPMEQYFMAHSTSDVACAMHRATVAIGQTIGAQATFMGYADYSCAAG
jgi:MFS family permease